MIINLLLDRIIANLPIRKKLNVGSEHLILNSELLISLMLRLQLHLRGTAQNNLPNSHPLTIQLKMTSNQQKPQKNVLDLHDLVTRAPEVNLG